MIAHWAWWLIGAVGISGALCIGIGVVLGWPVLVGTKIGRVLLAVATLGIALIVALGKARQDGIQAEKDRQAKEDADFQNSQAARDRTIAADSDADLDRVLTDHGNTGSGQK